MCPKPECHGISGLYFGQLSCFDCWMLADANAHDAMAAWSA